jgi:predicted nucleic acid-binding protein
MTAVFADTCFYVAFLSRRDKRHQAAREWASQQRTRVLTTEFVLLEVANFCRSPNDRERFTAFVQALQTNPLTTIVPCESTWFERGLKRFSSRRDKEWSLTDCISFVVMEDNGVTEARTDDHHFAQTGFTTLLARG